MYNSKKLGEINRKEGTTIVIVEQYLTMISSLAEYCIVFEKGKLVAEGTCEKIQKSEILHEYLAI